MEDVITALLPSLVKRSVFGDREFVGVEEDTGASLAPQFSSKVALINLTLRANSGNLEVIPLVVKVPFVVGDVTDRQESKTIFHNEVMMYKDLLPILDVNHVGSYPKLYYGFAAFGDDPAKYVIIMENLRSNGFHFTGKGVFLDFNHISVAMRDIGKLHSFSYSLKNECPDTFYENVKKLKYRKVVHEEDEHRHFLCMKRGVDAVMRKNIEVKNLSTFLKVMKPLEKILEFLREPNEPFAVLTHGDFCNNNIFFKYDQNGIPVDCAYFDFQYTAYGSPVIDLSFFLYMHTTAEDREENWDKYLEIYWKSVQDNVSPSVKLPSFDEFLEYFAVKAVLGYHPCSFYLPMMAFPDDCITMEQFASLTSEEKEDFNVNYAGDKGEKLISDIVSHLVVKKYLQKFLDYYNNCYVL